MVALLSAGVAHAAEPQTQPAPYHRVGGTRSATRPSEAQPAQRRAAAESEASREEPTSPRAADVARNVYILGDVPLPGPLPFVEGIAPSEYLQLAGLEDSERAGLTIQVLRPDGTMRPLDADYALSGGDTLLALRPAERPAAQPPVRPTVPAEEPEMLPEAAARRVEDERSIRVVGAVRRPLSIPYDQRWALQDYLDRAGGFAEDADHEFVRVLRPNGQLRLAAQVSQVLPGDRILVPRAPAQAEEPAPAAREEAGPARRAPAAEPHAALAFARVLVTGAVVRPMSFLFQSALGVGDYIRLAGGPTERADVSRVRVLRRDGSFVARGDALEPGDIIVVPAEPEPATAVSLAPEEDALRAEQEAQRQYAVEGEQALQRFGVWYFEGARRRIRNLERQVRQLAPAQPSDHETESPAPSTAAPQQPSLTAVLQDAVTGFVGPTDLLDANALMSIPHQQTIFPGDELTVVAWSPSVETPPETYHLQVSPEGEVLLPTEGRLVVRGMTLEQFEAAARELLARTTYADLRVVASFARLRTIQVAIVGSAFRPGNYALSAAATLFNALYFCGGPDESGSLRHVTLKRGTTTHRVDFYRYLLDGDAHQDMRLAGGDMIWIGRARRQVAVTGEVQRPAIYELADDEGFLDLVEMAGGIRPSGFAKTVQIDSVENYAERVLRTLDASGTLEDPPPLRDGDRVTVYPVLSEPVNTIQVSGYVKQPRVYELRPGMRVADAIRLADGLRPEAYRARADIWRRNPDGRTYTLVPTALGAAVEGDTDANVPLQAYDRIVVYSEFEVDWRPPRAVSAHGAVTRPGSYARADAMRVSDLLRLAGGPRPEAYKPRALLLRSDARNRMAISIPVNLEGLSGDGDPLLEDGDVLLALTHEEAEWEPQRDIRVTGAVQNPGLYPYSEGMRVSDALFRAGGLLPNFSDTALLLRKEERWDRVGLSRVVALRQALAGDADADILMQPEDELIVYSLPEARWEPAREVTVWGAVQRGNTYPRTEGMRVSDLLFRAGGVRPNAYLRRADLLRFAPDFERRRTVPVDLEAVIAGDRAADIVLQDGDSLRVVTLREAEYVPDDVVTIFGAVQRPDTYPWTEGMRLTDLLFVAGGPLPGARPEVEIARARGEGRTDVLRADADAAMRGDEAANLSIVAGDVVSVMRSRTFYETPRLVYIEGEVNYPGPYALESRDTISDLIRRAGGLTERAYVKGAVFQRAPEHIATPAQRQSVAELWRTIEDMNELEYERTLARARVEAQRQGANLEALDVLGAAVRPIASAVGAAPTAAVSALTGEPEARASEREGGEVTVVERRTEAPPSEPTTPEDRAPGTERVRLPGARVVNLVTPARTIENLLDFRRVVIDLPAILANPRSNKDLVLEAGDRLTVPPRQDIIAVEGAVNRRGLFVYDAELRIEDYLTLAGGLAADGDQKGIYVVRASGLTYRAEKVKRLEPGDVIVVRPRVMTERIAGRWDSIVGILRFVTATAATTAILIVVLSR
jgi:protein involved in polysaccharide export with SLBB domain